MKHFTCAIAFSCILLGLSGCSSQVATLKDTPINSGSGHAKSSPNDIIFESVDVALAEVEAIEQVPKGIPAETLWMHIANNYSFANGDYPQIQAHIDWLARNQSYMDRITERGERYVYFILEQIKERNLPYELALLPAVESAYEPMAYSHSHAAGLWQFIPSTGKQYGLKRDWWVDQRRDIIASTEAALDYLQYLNNQFNGDWLLALAAYNCGEGNVRRAIAKNRRAGKPTDFWSLKLPRETRGYVPRLLALAKVIQKPAHFNLQLPQSPVQPAFEVVELPAQISLVKAAEIANVELNTIEYFNPAYKRLVTHPQGPHRLLLPTGHGEDFQQQLASLPMETWKPESQYQVKRGDSLYTIAKRHHLDVASLREYNHLSSNTLQIGQRLQIPGSGVAVTMPGYSTTYTVASGDSLWHIAKKHNVSVTDIKDWNNLVSSRIKAGQQLTIASGNLASNSSKDSRAVKKLTYKVRSGDSLSRIASKFYLSISQIVEWNKINRQAFLQPGQRLTLFVDTNRL